MKRVLCILIVFFAVGLYVSIPLADAAQKKKAKSSDQEEMREKMELMEKMEMMEKMDKMDKMEMSDHLEAARTCAIGNNFSCANERLAKARKLAVDNADRNKIASADSFIQGEKKRYDNEVRIAAEKKRIEEAARIAAQEQEQQRAQPSSGRGYSSSGYNSSNYSSSNNSYTSTSSSPSSNFRVQSPDYSNVQKAFDQTIRRMERQDYNNRKGEGDKGVKSNLMTE